MIKSSHFHRNKYLPKRLGLFALIFSFGMMVGFGPVLHAHELDPLHLDENCAPCHFSQSSSDSLSIDAPDISTAEQSATLVYLYSSPTCSVSFDIHTGRSPPAFR